MGHFIWSAQFGGIGKVVYDLSRFQNSGNKVTPALLIGRSSGEMLNEYQNSGILIRELGFRSGRVISPGVFRSIKRVLEGVDIIHMHTFNPLFAWAAISTGKPVIYTIHGNFGFNRTLSFLEKMNRWFLKYFLNHNVSHITFNSIFAQDQARKFYGIKNIPQDVIGNGVMFREPDTYDVDEDTMEFVKGKKVIGTSSRFVEIKRIDKLITAFSKVSRIIPDAVLLLVGDGKMKTSYEDQVRTLGIENKVHFTGFRNNATSYQSLMDICVFPSFNEAFGLVAIETLYLGKPTIVLRDGGGMADIVMRVRSNDVVAGTDQLTSRITEYLKVEISDKDRNELRSYAEGFDISHMASDMYDLYNKLKQ